jgi:hypothetical protein
LKNWTILYLLLNFKSIIATSKKILGSCAIDIVRSREDGERDFLPLVDVLNIYIINMDITIPKPLQTFEQHHLMLVQVLLKQRKLRQVPV